MDNNIELSEETKALVDTDGVVVETVPLDEDKVVKLLDMAELVRKAKSGKFMEFTFPMMCSGLDPENPEETLIKMVYPTIQFSTPASPRNIRKHIIKLIKTRYRKQITTAQAKAMFDLGVEHMYRIRGMAQDAIDNIEMDAGEAMHLVAQAQEKAEKELDENPDVERV